MSFHDMYQRCRESFLVNSDQTLRAQLIEFRDHKLIKSKKVYMKYIVIYGEVKWILKKKNKSLQFVVPLLSMEHTVVVQWKLALFLCPRPERSAGGI